MTYLILKMMVYLLLAIFAGGGAGWLLRNLAASKREKEMQATLADARARVPQVESLMRTRDQQIVRLNEDLSAKNVRINALLDKNREKEKALRDKDRELKQLAARNHTLEQANDSASMKDASTDSTMDRAALDSDASDEDKTDSGEARELQAEIGRLERELGYARATTADAVAEAAATEAEVVTLKAELSRVGGTAAKAGGNGEAEELETRLRQKAEEYERLNKMLETEQRKVAELERERRLQNKSLQVLHQQLELERERGQRTAAG